MIHVTYSDYNNWVNCGFQYFLKKVARVKQDYVDANLVYGSAVHKGIEAVLRNQLDGGNRDPIDWFNACFEKLVTGKSVKTNSKFGLADLQKMGVIAVGRFPDIWYQSQIIPLVDDLGEPYIERELSIQLSPDVVLDAHPDLLGLHYPTGGIVVCDFKTAAQAHGLVFGKNSGQLTTYQLIAEEILGESVSALGFLDLLKKKDPEVKRLQLYERRDDHRVNHQIGEFLRFADGIAGHQYFRRSGNSYDTSCTSCEFCDGCVENKYDDLLTVNSSLIQVATN